MENSNKVILASAARTVTTNGSVQVNYQHRGLHLIVDVTVAPGADTITPKIEGYDPATGKYYTILEGTAINATGTTVLKVYPGITASANAAANDFLPAMWRVVLTHSAGTSFTYSVTANLQA